MYRVPHTDRDEEAKRKVAEEIAELATALIYGSPPALDADEDPQPNNQAQEDE
jgi:hypothetical protein